MLQRIQSLYLLIIVALLLSMHFIPVAEFLLGNQLFEFYIGGIKESGNMNVLFITTYPLLILFVISGFIAFLTFFLFKRRSIQMRLCRLNMMIIIGSLALFAYYIYRITVNENASWKISFAAIIPIIALILYYLALKAIKKDEDLIRSIDRIR